MEQQTPQQDQIKKPSILAQVLPYLFTIAILAFVFSGLSSSVVDEKHALAGEAPATLAKTKIKLASIKVLDQSGQTEFCGAFADKIKEACPNGPDFIITAQGDKTSIQRAPASRIPDGATVSLSYANKISAADIWALVRAADLRLFLPAMILHCLVFFLADIFSFGVAYRFFNVPGMSYREIAVMRGAPYVIQVGLAALAEALFPLYMLRVKKVPVTETLSSNIWTIIIDTAAMFSLITPGVIYNLFIENLVPAIGKGWLIVCAVYWTVLLGNIVFWHTGRGKSFAEKIAARRAAHTGSVGGGVQLLRTFSLAHWSQYLKVYAVRLTLWCSFFLSNYLALRAMGAHPSAPLALIAIPLIVASIFQPIGVGGYGGPQLIAWFLLVKLGEAGTADQIIGYSLLYSTTFLLGRALIGLVFIRQFWKKCLS